MCIKFAYIILPLIKKPNTCNCCIAVFVKFKNIIFFIFIVILNAIPIQASRPVTILDAVTNILGLLKRIFYKILPKLFFTKILLFERIDPKTKKK